MLEGAILNSCLLISVAIQWGVDGCIINHQAFEIFQKFILSFNAVSCLQLLQEFISFFF